jgi:hypothetical protein
MLILLVFILVFACGFVLPWWIVAIIAFGAAFWLAHSGSQAFWSSFLSVFVAWVLLSMLKSAPNQHILAAQVARLFHLPHWTAIMAITGCIGGLVGGFAGLTGYLFKGVFNYTGSDQ